MAALPPAIAAIAAPGYRSYREFYDDADNDPYQGHYEAIVARFNTDPPPPAVAATPAALVETVCNTTQQPGPAFLMYCRPAYDPVGTAGPKIMLFHRLARYGEQIGLPTVWDGQAFAFLGDVVPPHSDIGTVAWDSAFFFRTNVMRVQHQDVFGQALEAFPDAATFGPFDAADAATTDTRRVRLAAYVPPKYVNLFLGHQLSPREACDRCCPLVGADGLADTLADLLFWLRATMTIQAGGGESPLLTDHPTVPMATAELISHRRHLLFTDLPALSTGVVGQGAQLIAGAVGTLVEQNREFRTADEQRKAADTKTPDTFLGAAVQSLLRLAQVATSGELPPLWQGLATATKTHQRSIIQMAIDEALQVIAPGGGRAYIVTPSVAKKVACLEFRMSNPEDLATGLQPFILVQTTPGERQSAQALVHVFDTVMGGASASVADAQTLIANDPATLPRTLTQARTCLTVFQGFLRITLGHAHPWTRGLHMFRLQMVARETELEGLPTRNLQYRNLVPSLIVRWIQLRWDDWLQSQWYAPLNVPVPELTDLFSHIRLDTAWEPTLPSQYLRLTPPQAPGGPTGSAPPAGATSTAGMTVRGTIQSAAPTLGPSTIVRNTTYLDTDFGIYRSRDVRIRDLLVTTAATPPPASSHDNPAARGHQPNTPVRICLSYHIKGMCNTRCGRSCDHKPLTDAKRQELLTWCAAHYVAPALA
jgi:hypothetical protein